MSRTSHWPRRSRSSTASTSPATRTCRPREADVRAPPADCANRSGTVDEATERAAIGIENAGWQVVGAMPSPVLGGRGAVEALLHARKPG